MDSIANYAANSLKASRKRNILIALTILLSTLLITIISIFFTSMQSAEQKFFEKTTGSYHCRVSDITGKQIKILRNNRDVDIVGEEIWCDSLGNKSIGKNNVNTRYYDLNGAKMNYCFIRKGRLPKKSNEVAAEKWVIKKFGVKVKVGSHIKLFSSGKEREFRICGILKDNSVFRNTKKYSLLVSRAYAQKVQNGYEGRKIMFRVKTGFGRNIEETVDKVIKEAGIKSDVSKNFDFIDSTGTGRPISKILIFLGLIVVLATVIVIYNIFYISVIDRIRQFGLLAAIGATRQQIRRIITKEGLALSFAAISGGVAGGIILGCIIIHIISLSPSDGIVVVAKLSLWNVVVPAIVSGLAVIIALRRPGAIASKISPIEAVSYNDATTGKKEKRKGFHKITLLKLAYTNLHRSLKRTVVTTVAISICGVLFIVFSSIMQLYDAGLLIRRYDNHDFQSTRDSINVYLSSSKAIKAEVIKEEEAIKELKGMRCIRNFDLIKYYDVEIPDMVERSRGRDIFSWASFYGYSYKLMDKLNDSMISKRVIPKDMDKDNGIILVWNSREYKCPYKLGQKISIPCEDYKNPDSEPKNFTVRVKGIAKNYPEFVDEYNNGPVFIGSMNLFSKMFGKDVPGKIFFDADKKYYASIENKLDELGLEYDEYRKVRKEAESFIGQLKIAGMGLVLIIGIIGTINLINTMVTTIVRRKKELGMLQAIGLTSTQMKNMIRFEGLYYAIIGSVISILFGNFLGYSLCNMLIKSKPWIEYHPPILPSIAVLVVFVVIQLVIVSVIQRKINSESIVEQIRHE